MRVSFLCKGLSILPIRVQTIYHGFLYKENYSVNGNFKIHFLKWIFTILELTFFTVLPLVFFRLKNGSNFS
ncbi:MAG: hypothetical protein JWM09_1367 [Francisellaceae bacterium]|nr:hypothetical protein [Francisellaceae bacterium]